MVKEIRAVFAKKQSLAIAICLALITSAAFLPSLSNGFTNWDDPEYILNNEVIRSSPLQGPPNIFTAIVVKNWHPLTLLSYSAEYHLFGLNPFAFHFTNLILHVLNTLLVFAFIRALTALNGVSFLAALFFGVHPLHVESVAWIAERKDVLFSFFYLLGLVTYCRYLKTCRQRDYILTILWFFLSLVSKVAAVSFPLILIVVDLYRGRQFSKKDILEKVPFFVLSLIFGIIALNVHSDVLITRGKYLYQFGILDRLVLSSYALLMYLGKVLVPVDLAVIYPYPEKIGGWFPAAYYISPFIVGVLIFLVIIFRKRKEFVFASLFFIVAILENLPFSVIGQALIADRYTYIPGIGIFSLLAVVFFEITQKMRSRGNWFPWEWLLVSGYLIFLFTVTFGRCGIWRDSETLWSAAIRERPSAWVAYYNRASYYLNEEQFPAAISDLDQAEKLGPVYIYMDIFSGRGQAYGKMGRPELAIENYSKAIEIRPNFAGDYNNRGIVYMNTRSYQNAIKDFTKAIELDPNLVNSLNHRGLAFLHLGQFENAIKDFERSILMSPGYLPAYQNLARTYQVKGDLKKSLELYGRIIASAPNDFENYYNRAIVYLKSNEFGRAMKDFDSVISLNPSFFPVYYSRSLAKFSQGDPVSALADALTAKKLGMPVSDEYLKVLTGQIKK